MDGTITIEREEYERLCEAAEDLADLRAYDRAKESLASGADELLPHEYARRLVAGRCGCSVICAASPRPASPSSRT